MSMWTPLIWTFVELTGTTLHGVLVAFEVVRQSPITGPEEVQPVKAAAVILRS
jgi:hypothetical protein